MKRIDLFTFIGIFVILALASCRNEMEPAKAPVPALFTAINPAETGVTFENELSFDEEFNIYTYRNYYNGGGVALGDVNNDGLLDIYLTGNLVPNRLYLNEGGMKFTDVTEEAGVAGNRAWSTGVSMADVNSDGWLDIYVCNSGDIEGDNKQNELFINNGDGTFTEQAEAYGLADRGFSTHAAFFDYDKDGDLDVYLLNNSYQAIGSFNLMQNKRPERDPVGGDKLFRNDGNTFTDVSEEAGIYGSVIGFGLGVTVGDVNEDTWPDIFISNDFFERDYLYINNGDGTFTEKLEGAMKSISAASMGADMADINNDGLMDIFVTDMLPESLERIKQVTTFENWDKHMYNVQNNYHYQFTRNMLHLNNGDGTFTEIGRMSGVEATDWSWGALIFDMDNDGYRDIFVANGIYQDITDLDYLNFIQDDETKRKIITEEGVDYKGLIDPIPVNPIPNYAFRNNGDLTFTNMADAWGLGNPVHSNGSAYGDLDNDGDLDLVVNNVNVVSDIFRNNAREVYPDNHFLQVRLTGTDGNTDAVGAQITLKTDDLTLYAEQQPTRGFESSVDPLIHFGVGNETVIREVSVLWPDGRKTILNDVPVDQVVALDQKDASVITAGSQMTSSETVFRHVDDLGLPYRHEENAFVDFDRDRLTYHMRSNEGPAAAMGDVNGDGVNDLYLGGARGYTGKLYLGNQDGSFTDSGMDFSADARSEDVDAAFFDADGDGDNDLYVASGGGEFGLADPALRDRLYINDGSGNFSRGEQPALDKVAEISSVVAPVDFDNDGDMDLFVGTRMVPFKYGFPADSYLLENDGSGQFVDVTEEKAPALIGIGMVTDAAWTDSDGDGDADLMISGEWMAPKLLVNNNGSFSFQSAQEYLDQFSGWYNTLLAADVDGDGDEDILLGNLGLNSRFKAASDSPLIVYISDFDRNGSPEHIFAVKGEDGREYPLTLKHELVMQMPSLKKKYLKFKDYNDKPLTEVFTREQLDGAVRLEVTEFRSALLLNNGGGEYSWQPLPTEVQLSPVYAFLAADVDQDGKIDVLAGGNQYRVKPEAGRYDASRGVYLHNEGNGNFRAVPALESGISINGEVRELFVQPIADQERRLLIVRNNDTCDAYDF